MLVIIAVVNPKPSIWSVSENVWNEMQNINQFVICRQFCRSELEIKPYFWGIKSFMINSWYSGWPLIWKTWKSQRIEKWSGKSQEKWIIAIIQLPGVLFRQKYATMEFFTFV